MVHTLFSIFIFPSYKNARDIEYVNDILSLSFKYHLQSITDFVSFSIRDDTSISTHSGSVIH